MSAKTPAQDWPAPERSGVEPVLRTPGALARPGPRGIAGGGGRRRGRDRVGSAIKIGRFSGEDAFSSSPRQIIGRIPFPQREDSLNDDGQLLWL